MVALACETPAERALVPAFVYFFQLLYPFARVNAPASRAAAAAGGTMLVRADALARIGGLAADARRAHRRRRARGQGQGGRPDLARPQRAGPVGAALSGFRRHLAHDRADRLRAASLLLPPACRHRARPRSRVSRPSGRGDRGPWNDALDWPRRLARHGGELVPTLRRYGRSWLWGAALPTDRGVLHGGDASARRSTISGAGAWSGRAAPTARRQAREHDGDRHGRELVGQGSGRRELPRRLGADRAAPAPACARVLRFRPQRRRHR